MDIFQHSMATYFCNAQANIIIIKKQTNNVVGSISKFRHNIVSHIFTVWVGGDCIAQFPSIFLRQSSESKSKAGEW